jgi:hypothetical protein
MLGQNGIFPGKSFEKSFFPRNSTEFSALSEFPRKQMYDRFTIFLIIFVIYNNVSFPCLLLIYGFKAPSSSLAGFDLTSHKSSLHGGRRRRCHYLDDDARASLGKLVVWN